MGFHIHIHNLKGNMMMKPMGFLNWAFFFSGSGIGGLALSVGRWSEVLMMAHKA
jgi:hypothetical protein